MWGFSLVVIRHPETKKYLIVQENKRRGWWIPGGFVEPGDDFVETAKKETMEEAGINVELKGILRVEQSFTLHGLRQRVIFYGEPADLEEEPKSEPDSESMGAQWMDFEEIKKKNKVPPPQGMRGPEPFEWAEYLINGGPIYPLSILAKERDHPIIPKK
eukprot:CAMPEP_0119146320 /NCGR_PEP_ID=MMETSP1310-20130426/38716_1 /TAXON_ID=464262 /ORGANISM="Genus nov. species nov., Strain RCC2339" /LENGTH=158 /DNA_ID=CAMNT_0007138199 /DNA_START=209 /DNA_END=685 /DNA_ORIENTATION=-